MNHNTAASEATSSDILEAARGYCKTLIDKTDDVARLHLIAGVLNGNSDKLPPQQLPAETTEQKPRRPTRYKKGPLRLAITRFLRQAGGVASTDDIFAAVKDYCAPDDSKREVHEILIKNSRQFCRRNNGKWAIVPSVSSSSSRP